MYKENPKTNWDIEYKSGYMGKKVAKQIVSSELEKAGDDLVWAIETVIEHPMDIKCWFLVKDALSRYKTVRHKTR